VPAIRMKKTGKTHRTIQGFILFLTENDRGPSRETLYYTNYVFGKSVLGKKVLPIMNEF